LQEHLARVEQRIADSERIIARERASIARLERANLEVKSARELLAQFERLLALQIADRDRLRRELGSDHVQ
jgi:hypothetical protein